MSYRYGEIISLGRHKLICGDCTDPDIKRRLFKDSFASTIIFSPPYIDRRRYAAGQTPDATSLFVEAINVPSAIDVQVFSVVGNIHHNGQQLTYYEAWLHAAKLRGWRRFSTYIWDKQHGLPGKWGGRLAPCFEWVFHLNRKSRDPFKFRPTIWGRGRHTQTYNSRKGNTIPKANGKSVTVSDFKIDDAIIRVNPAGCSLGTKHPAVFPVELPYRILQSYGTADGVVYDPMCGSGTTILAADKLGRASSGCELSSDYCAIAVERWRKHEEAIRRNQAFLQRPLAVRRGP